MIILGYFSPVIHITYDVGTHRKHLLKALLMSTHNINSYREIRKFIPELSPNTPPLTHISLASLLWDIGKQCRP